MPKGFPSNREETLAKRSESMKAYNQVNKVEPIERFLQKIEISDNRFSYEYFRGQIPRDLQIDHLCRNRPCVNPDHLEVVTPVINTQRGDTGLNQLEKTHCPYGHSYDESNTYNRPDRPQRNCKICKREAERRWRGKQKSPGTTQVAIIG